MIRSLQDEQRHIQRCMQAPHLSAAFTKTYTIERHPMALLPTPIPPKRMTFDDAYELAYIRACELDSPNSPDFDALHERLCDLLCIKHNISD